jgi:tetratricopeptide (TPR) repeat protein
MESNHILSLPIVNEENICLPLVITAVSKYWGIELPFSESKEIAKKYPNMKGSILVEGIELAERHGLVSLILNSTIKELKKLIDMGIPPIIILPGIRDTVQHASLILGYDDIEKTILHYFPEPDKIGAIPEKKFDEQWSEDDRLLIVLVPADIFSEINLENNIKEKSNRLCFNAEKLRLQGKLSDAMDALQKALEINPSNSTALCLLGGMLNDQNSSNAVQYYEKSIKSNSRCYLAYRGLGNFYLKSKDYPSADKYYTKAIEINQNRFVPIYKNRGLARLEQNQKTGDKKDLEKYLEQMPNASDKTGILEVLKEL